VDGAFLARDRCIRETSTEWLRYLRKSISWANSFTSLRIRYTGALFCSGTSSGRGFGRAIAILHDPDHSVACHIDFLLVAHSPAQARVGVDDRQCDGLLQLMSSDAANSLTMLNRLM
jgi:hypothetical protein